MGDFITDITLAANVVGSVSEPKYGANQTNAADEVSSSEFSSLITAQLEEEPAGSETPEAVSQAAEPTVEPVFKYVEDAPDMCYASSLIGREVVLCDYSSGAAVQRTVQITGSGMWNGEQVLRVDEEIFALNSIIEIHSLPGMKEEDARIEAIFEKEGNLPRKVETPYGPGYDDGIGWPDDDTRVVQSKTEPVVESTPAAGDEPVKDAAPIKVQMPTLDPKAAETGGAGEKAVDDLIEALEETDEPVETSDEPVGTEQVAALSASVSESQMRSIRSYLQVNGISYRPNATAAELVALLNDLTVEKAAAAGYAGQQNRTYAGSGAEQPQEDRNRKGKVQETIPAQEM